MRKEIMMSFITRMNNFNITQAIHLVLNITKWWIWKEWLIEFSAITSTLFDTHMLFSRLFILLIFCFLLDRHTIHPPLLGRKMFILNFLLTIRYQNAKTRLIDRILSCVFIEVSHFHDQRSVTPCHSFNNWNQILSTLLIGRLNNPKTLVFEIGIRPFIIMRMSPQIQTWTRINHRMKIWVHSQQSILTKQCLPTTNQRIVRYRDHEKTSFFANRQLRSKRIQRIDSLLLEINKIERVEQSEVQVSKLESTC